MAVPTAAAPGKNRSLRGPPVSSCADLGDSQTDAVDITERQQSPTNGEGLTLSFSSNNPFRNRLSGASPSPRSAEAAQPNFPFPNMSKNPFLDPNDGGVNNKTATNGNGVALADDIFVSVTVLGEHYEWRSWCK